MPTLNDIRSTFLGFFDRNDHRVVESSPLVPRNDPTLMFTNSGMVQFKNCFTGVEHRDYTRATTSQKCVRAGGKHNDLDNVGYTARHHTFFEMLGNFSFGDYFKDDAIRFAWELLTRDFGLDRSKLLVTVYHTDDEAASIWKKVAGLPDERIIRIATDDNFWSMGATGPCGPCSEIFYDHGPEIWGGPPGSAEEDGDRFIEIWNLVFMQFERFEDGTQRELDMQSIDTGMGLERVAAVLQGVHDNYDTDLMRALIEASAHATNSDPDGRGNVHHRVIADHLRSTSFLIADGVMPSNEGRGYVLRRIMRRAMRHAHLLGAEEPLMWRLVPTLVREMGRAYPELTRAEALITETLKLEERRFRKTLARGLTLLDDASAGLGEGAEFDGETAFKLYDTYGFPLDLTQDALRARGVSVDLAAFNTAMERQRAEARAAWSGSGEAATDTVWFTLKDRCGATDFLGYDTETAEGVVAAMVRDGGEAMELKEGDTGFVVLNQTPFYGESGGQVGDTGRMRGEGGVELEVTDTQKKADGLFVHEVRVISGKVTIGLPLELLVDATRRGSIRANHSATHLVHEALREVLGTHVAQKGSLVSPERLRFDFSHPKPMSAEELAEVEEIANQIVLQNAAVETRLMGVDEAIEEGAMALFGEKYGDEVRVVSMGRALRGDKAGKTYSAELCGGTHVSRTGDIGVVTLVTEGAVAAGVRRIEALTGAAARRHLAGQDARVREIASVLKSGQADVAERVAALVEEKRRLERELADTRKKLAMSGGAGDAGDGLREIGGVKLMARIVEGLNPKDLKGLADEAKGQIGSGIVVLVNASEDNKAAIVVGVTGDLTDRFNAVDLVKVGSEVLGGRGGGGRPDMAQAGGSDASQAEAAVTAIAQALETAAPAKA